MQIVGAVGFPLRPAKKAVKPMSELQHMMLPQMYVEERLAKAAHERLLREAERVRRARPMVRVALKARLGRTLVSVGQRLEAAEAV